MLSCFEHVIHFGKFSTFGTADEQELTPTESVLSCCLACNMRVVFIERFNPCLVPERDKRADLEL